MAEIYVVTHAGRLPVHPALRRRVRLTVGDRIEIGAGLALALEQRDGALCQVWRWGTDEHVGPIELPATVARAGIAMIVCRAYSERHALLEVQFDGQPSELAITRAS